MIRKILIMVMLTCVLLVGAPMLSSAAQAQGKPSCPYDHVAGSSPLLPQLPTPAPGDGEVDAADADPADSEDPVVTGSDELHATTKCAKAEAYPGPFDNPPEGPRSSYISPNPIAATAPAAPVAAPAAAPRAAAPLAHSGTEAFVLAYIGTGLVAFGAVALGSRRRLFKD